MYEIQQTDQAIDEQLNRATEGEERGSQYPGMSYEEGVSNALHWLLEAGEWGEPLEERDEDAE